MMIGTDVILEKIFDAIVGETLHGALERLMANRMAIAREEILAQLKKGKHWAISDDDAAAATFTYLRAAQEGVARENLRMIAEALVNGAQEATFAPDEFRRHANTLANLSRDETILLAEFIRVHRAYAASDQVIAPENYSAVIWASISQTSFPPGFDFVATAGALSRTGWVVPQSGFGGITYCTSATFDAVSRLVDFEAAASQSAEDGKTGQ
ncbi:MAG TPA: hypothetical protein VGL66_16835 [Caulobacteraceae bacterium]|jgi:hypothetical protein